MIEHPDFFKPGKLAIAFAAGPLFLLLLIIGIDFSWQQWRLVAANRLCNQPQQSKEMTALSDRDCPSGVQYTGHNSAGVSLR